MIKEKNILYKAKSKDSSFFYKLRNNPYNRKYSLNSNYIKFDDHTNWFKRANKDRKQKLFVVKLSKKNRAGYVRFKKNKDKTYVSICIDQKYRKQNLATKSLLQSEKFIYNSNVYSKVKSNNIGSKKLFTKIGYEVIKKSGKFLTMKKKLNGLKIIDKIESIRGKNNFNWMNLLRLAYRNSPRETSVIMSKIYKDDKKISNLVKKLIK